MIDELTRLRTDGQVILIGDEVRRALVIDFLTVSDDTNPVPR